MANGSRSSCKDCGAAIKWRQDGGRWIPEDPTTGSRHRCEIERTCEGPGCGKAFKGAPWMSLCPSCYRGQGGGRNRPQEPASPPRAKEKLGEVGDDDVPF